MPAASQNRSPIRPGWSFRPSPSTKSSRWCCARGEDDPLRAAVLMQQGREVPLSSALALEAARLAHELSLAMADAVILATARATGATLWTQDVDFEGIAGVRFFPKVRG